MKYLPILQELLALNTLVIFLIGLAMAILMGLFINTAKKSLIGLLFSLVAYVVCEILQNTRATPELSIVELFIGTGMLGSALGFFVGLIINLIRSKRE